MSRTTLTQTLFPKRKIVSRGFSLIEVLFAIGMLGVGIVAILSLFTTGIASAAYSGNVTTCAMEVQSLYTRVISESNGPPSAYPATVPPQLTREFLFRMALLVDNGNAMANPSMWIHNDRNNTPDPVLVDNNRDLYWQCRSSKNPMNKDTPMDVAQDDKTTTYPKGLYQIAIAVYRNIPAGGAWGNMANPPKQPIAVYTTLVTAF